MPLASARAIQSCNCLTSCSCEALERSQSASSSPRIANILSSRSLFAKSGLSCSRAAGVRVAASCLGEANSGVANYSYFPILLDAPYPLSRDALYESLRAHNIFARRYFYPLIAEFPMYRDMPSAHPANLDCANNAAQKVLCLPIYSSLRTEDIDRIVRIVRKPVMGG